MSEQNKAPKMSIRQRIDARKKEDKNQKKITFSDLLVDVKRNPMILIGLGGSAFFSALMGLFIGLAPRLTETGDLVLFGGKVGAAAVVMGIVFGLLYAISFPVLGEWGTYYWHRKASLRDIDNRTQAIIGYGMMILAGVFTVTTAVAASVILASLLHTFTAFNAIPDWAQKWTVLVIPISLAFHAGANIWYDHVSKYAEERREMERELQTVEIEAENRIRQARVQARESAAIAMADEYERISSMEAVSAGRKTAVRAWNKDKVELGEDEDGDGIPNVADKDWKQDSGNGHHRQPAMAASTPAAELQSHPAQPRQYTLAQFLSAIDQTADSARAVLKQYGLSDANTAWSSLKQYGVLPADLTRKNFSQLYGELMTQGTFPNPQAGRQNP